MKSLHRFIALFVSASMLLTTLPVSLFAAEMPATDSHGSDSSVEEAIDPEYTAVSKEPINERSAPIALLALEETISGYCGGEGEGTNLTWSLTTDGVLTISGTGAMADYNNSWAPWKDYSYQIKNLCLNEGITSIGANAFYDCKYLTGDLVIPQSVYAIGDGAFWLCKFSGTLSIPSNVVTIASHAFAYNDFVKVEIPAGTKLIEEEAFRDCHKCAFFLVDSTNDFYTNDEYGVLFSKDKKALIQYPHAANNSSYSIPEGVISFNEGSFEDSDNLQFIHIPSTVSEIQAGVFYSCSNLQKITVAENNLFYCADEYGVLFDRDKTRLLQAPCAMEQQSYSMPNTVLSIDNSAFSTMQMLSEILLSENLNTISSYAFEYNFGIKDIIIPHAVSYIGTGAFRMCEMLENVYFEGNAPTQYKSYYRAFLGCAEKFTIHYIDGASGWTDSDAYDADAGTWHGYQLAIWDLSDACAHSYNFKLVNGEPVPVSGSGKWTMLDNTYCQKSVRYWMICDLCGDEIEGTEHLPEEENIQKHATSTTTEIKQFPIDHTDYTTKHQVTTTHIACTRNCGYAADNATTTSTENHGFVNHVCKCGYIEVDSATSEVGVRVAYNGHTYQLFNLPMNWLSAKAFCEEVGGHLVTITDESEQQAMISLLQSATHTVTSSYNDYSFVNHDFLNCYWIGAEKVSGKWKWVTGEAFSYANWKTGEPNNENNNEAYAELYAKIPTTQSGVKVKLGQWNDVMLSGLNGKTDNSFYSENGVGFICEWDTNLSTWDFKKDSYSFINAYSYFGKKGEPIYVNKSDMSDYLMLLSEGSIVQLAKSFVANPKKDLSTSELVKKLWNSDLKAWGGSCYGLSLTAALFKTGIAQTSYYGGSNTHEIPSLKKDTNSSLESWINIFQLSSALQWGSWWGSEKGHSPDFVEVMQEIWANATSIKNDDSVITPFIVFLSVDFFSKAGVQDYEHASHAVLCYGAEIGSWVINGKEYDKRLLISDPNNNTKTNFIYILSDFSDAKYSDTGHAYNTFAIYRKALTKLSVKGMDEKDSQQIVVDIPNMASFSIVSSAGTVIFENGNVISDTIGIHFALDTGIVAEGTEIYNETRIILPINDGYTIIPAKDEKLNATFYYKDFVLGAMGKADSVLFTLDGTMFITGADDELMLDVAQNEGAFDFLSIVCETNGDVAVSLDETHVKVSGALNNSTISHLTEDGNVFVTSVQEEISTVALSSTDVGAVEIFCDTNSDGVYETEIESVDILITEQDDIATIEVSTPAANSKILIATYDADGKLLNLEYTSGDCKNTILKTIALTDTAESIKVFLVDSNWNPLCEPAVKFV